MLEWMNEKIKTMVWHDISLVKLSVAAFILMIAKLWQPILSLAWYWYLIIGVLAAIKPMMKLFAKPTV